MWRGVESGLAGMKFSGSKKIYGSHKMIMVKHNKARENPNRSFIV